MHSVSSFQCFSGSCPVNASGTPPADKPFDADVTKTAVSHPMGYEASRLRDALDGDGGSLNIDLSRLFMSVCNTAGARRGTLRAEPRCPHGPVSASMRGYELHAGLNIVPGVGDIVGRVGRYGDSAVLDRVRSA